MSASHLPPVIEHPDGRHEIELEPGCRLIWWKTGDCWSLQVQSDALINFEIDRLHNEVRWPVQ
jgi:hypothetical protein